MGRMYKHGENDLFGMRADILKKEGTSLAEIGLLVLLLYNNDKDCTEALENICDDETTIDSAMQMLADDGFLFKDDKLIRVSDVSGFNGGVNHAEG